MPTIRANGLDIAYDVHGAGPAARPAPRRDVARARATSPPRSRCSRGRSGCTCPTPAATAGRAGTRPTGFRYDWLVDDLAAFVDAVGLETFHVVGFSMGAMTALQYAVRSPERLRTMTIVGITTQREPRASVARRLMDPDRADREEPAWVALLGRRHDEGQGAGAWRRLLPAIAADVAGQPLLTPRDLHRIDAAEPRRVRRSRPVRPGRSRLGLRRQLPDGRLFVAPDCGHEVMSRKPSLFNEALAGFFRSTEVDRPQPRRGSATTSPRRPATGVEPARRGPPADATTDRDWLDRRRSDRSHREEPPMTTLLALYRRPDGGDEALATFLRRYRRRAPAARRRRRPASARRGSSGSSRPSAARPTWS